MMPISTADISVEQRVTNLQPRRNVHGKWVTTGGNAPYQYSSLFIKRHVGSLR